MPLRVLPWRFFAGAILALGACPAHGTEYGIQLVSSYQDQKVVLAWRKAHGETRGGILVPGKTRALARATAYALNFGAKPTEASPKREALLVFYADGKAMDLAVFYGRNLQDPNRPVVLARGSRQDYLAMQKHFQANGTRLGFIGWDLAVVGLPELQGEEAASRPAGAGSPPTVVGNQEEQKENRSSSAPAASTGGESHGGSAPMVDVDMD